MSRPRLGTALPLALATLLTIWSCGDARSAEQLAQLQQEVADELAALRAEIAAAKLAPNDRVDIELQGVGPNTKIAIVDPPKKGSCRIPEPNCAQQVRWTLRGSIPADWTVKIEEKPSSPNQGCFATPTFDQSNRVALSGVPPESCQGAGATWEYSVTLYDQNGDARSMVDPLVVMNWSN